MLHDDTTIDLPARPRLVLRALFGVYEPALTAGGALFAMLTPAAFLGLLVPAHPTAELEQPLTVLLTRTWAVSLLVLAAMEAVCVWRGNRPALRGVLLALLVGDVVHALLWRQSFTGSAGWSFASVMNIGNTLLFAAVRVWAIARLRARAAGAPPPA